MRWMQQDPLGYVDGMSAYTAYQIPNGLDPLGLDVHLTHDQLNEFRGEASIVSLDYGTMYGNALHGIYVDAEGKMYSYEQRAPGPGEYGIWNQISRREVFIGWAHFTTTPLLKGQTNEAWHLADMYAQGYRDSLEVLGQIAEGIATVFDAAAEANPVSATASLATGKSASDKDLTVCQRIGVGAGLLLGVASVLGAFTDDIGGLLRQVGGRNPVNGLYAGKTHPSGVRYTKEGFPDFSPHAKAQVEISGLTGHYGKDAAMANRAVGLSTTPDGYVWPMLKTGLRCSWFLSRSTMPLGIQAVQQSSAMEVNSNERAN